MREQIEQRLAELQAEQEQGQRMLADLDAKRNTLAQTVLRIAGAVQVLSELLQAQPQAEGANEPG